MSQPFTVGVNYWPRHKAMYWWSRFDAGEVRDVVNNHNYLTYKETIS